ncbi:MAG: hypothetical protein ACR2PB_08475 [Desulfocapsaceae bacterium]
MDIQQQDIRELRVEPKEYYPEGYYPELMTQWPVQDDLVLPAEQVPDSMNKGMGQAARNRAAARAAPILKS